MNKFFGYFLLLTAALLFTAGCEDEPSIPIVKTDSVVPGSTTAEVDGLIISDGGSRVTRFGICISTDTDKPVVENSSGPFYTGSISGTFSMTIPQLEPNTVYYVRAFADNKLGTGYGKTITFTTE